VSLLDSPLALLDRVLARRSARVQPDDPVARMVARTTGRLRPSSSYRRRLRGRIMNQYVAVREGLAPPTPRRHMTPVGRAVLYAMVALALSVTAVGAASTSALPGDLLYPIKRQIEQIRIDIAPAWVRPTLVAEALDERISEVESLARDGRWNDVVAATGDVQAAADALEHLGVGIGPSQAADLTQHANVLTGLLATAPTAAKPGLEHAIAASSHAAAVIHGNGHGSGPAGAATATPRPTPPGQAGSPGPSRRPSSPPEPAATQPAH